MIKRLDQATINKIAAGEVIARPENVVKELLENCLDAQSTLIQIQVKDGGLKQIQITDNGTGILKEDLELVCERFTTSKLVEFKDLETIGTFGFRGEALASITYCSHVSIVSKTKDSPVAFKGYYSDGKLLSQPQPIAGNQGTQIVIEDLFYNIPTRKKALRNFTEEYNRILDVVQRYSIEFQGVSFNCKRFGAPRSDVVTQSNASRLDTIRGIFGNVIAKELLEFTYNSEKFKLCCNGYVSNPNYSLKKKEFILFINSNIGFTIARLVECPPLRNSLIAVYQKYLPKQAHAFLFLSLKIAPENVDVNVHPTKKQVGFLQQDAIIADMAQSLDDFLANASHSRVFYVQTSLPAASIKPSTSTPYTPVTKTSLLNNLPKPTPSHMLVRTDSRSRKITSFFTSTPTGPCLKKPKTLATSSELEYPSTNPLSSNRNPDKSDQPLESFFKDSRPEILSLPLQSEMEDVIFTSHIDLIPLNSEIAAESRKFDSTRYESQGETIPMPTIPSSSIKGPEVIEQPSEFDTTDREWIDVQLTSILTLRKQVRDHQSNVVTEQLQNHTFVGLFNDHLAVVQHNTQLLIVNFQEISGDLMYQRALFGFSNLGVIRIDPVSIKELVLISLEEMIDWDEDQNQPKTLVAQQISNLLVEKSELLKEYFSMIITNDGKLIGLPNLLDGCLPEFAKLPDFLLYMGASVDFTREQECFEGVCIALAKFYAFDTNLEGEEIWKEKVENYLFPALRNVIGLSEWTDRGLIVQVANLSDLYKIFERC